MAIRKISIGILVVLAIAGLLAGVWWFVLGGNKLSSTTPKPDDSTTTTDNATAPPADPTKHDYFEVSTAKQMIIYNQQAVELANIAQHGEADADMKKLTDEVIATHGKAAEQYAKWLNEWNESYLSLSDFPREDGHDAYPTNPGMPKVMELDKLTTMTAAEKEKEFLRLLLQLHEGALEYIDMRSGQIQYREMKSYAANDKAHFERKIQSIKNLQTTKGFN